MPNFLEAVLGAQDTKHPPARRAGDGLSGSGKRFAILLILMVGLTAVPTFIMIRAGTEELRSTAAAPVRPIVLGVPEPPPQPNKKPPVAGQQQGWSLPVLPPQPVEPQREPVLERKAVVDTSPRPVHKHKPAEPGQSKSEEPKREPNTSKSKKNKKSKKPSVERPWVEPPDLPDIDFPDIDMPEIDMPDIEMPEIDMPEIELPEPPYLPYLDRAERPRS
ncbi:MAG TPA: hypothetical protein VF062_14135 [Candidatus Limnocylindrales bacterium]